MKEFKLLPSSPDVKNMNDQQWIYCYMNIVKDLEEDEELFKMRAKYMGLFVNPEAVRKISQEEQKEKMRSKSYENFSEENKETIINNGGFVNDDFEREIREALGQDNFVAIPDDDDIRGDDTMSSDDFEKMCLQEFEKEEHMKNIEDDLDEIFIEDDED